MGSEGPSLSPLSQSDTRRNVRGRAPALSRVQLQPSASDSLAPLIRGTPVQPRRFALCAADDYDTRVVVSALLSCHGFEVLVAESVLTALLVARARAFHLYIFDARVGGKPGIELLKSIRDFDPLTPAVFFVSDAGDVTQREALAAGAAAYVEQPDCEALLEVIDRLYSPAYGIK